MMGNRAVHCKSFELNEDKYPLTLHLLHKERLTRREICAIFVLVLETLLKGKEICRLSEEELEETMKEGRKYLPIKTSKNCPVCSSPYRWQYELYYLSCDRNLEWVLASAYSLGERHITYKSLKNHFQKHFNPRLDISQASQRTLDKIAEKEGPDFVENVLTHFLFTNELLERLEKRIISVVDEGCEISSKDANLLKSLLITFLRYASWLRDFRKNEDEEVENLGKLFPFEI